MIDAAEPGDAALDAHAEACVRHTAETAQVEIPVERLARKLVADAFRSGKYSLEMTDTGVAFPPAIRIFRAFAIRGPGAQTERPGSIVWTGSSPDRAPRVQRKR